jgi:hypothetical protein
MRCEKISLDAANLTSDGNKENAITLTLILFL